MSMLHYLHLLELRNEDARTKNISLSNHIFYLDCWLSINIWTLGAGTCVSLSVVVKLYCGKIFVIYVGYLNCAKDCMSVRWLFFSYALPEISMVLSFP